MKTPPLKPFLLNMFTISFIVLGFAGFVAAAPPSSLAPIYELYKKGAYPQALELINAQINAPLVVGAPVSSPSPSPTFSPAPTSDAQAQETQATLHYWAGLCNNRMQIFDVAATHFQKAKALNANFEDLDYELGQALYSSQQMKPARDAFLASAQKNFKKGASTYYLAFISQILEEYPQALKTYDSIIKFPTDTENVKQGSLLQIAEVKLILFEKSKPGKDRNNRLRVEILPLFERTINYKDGTTVADQAKQRLAQIKTSMIAATPTLANGMPLPAQLWSVRLSQAAKYDTNVISQAEQSLTQVSNRASVISKSDLMGKYLFVFDNRWTLAPELGFAYTYHFNRNEPLVYQNDSLSTSTALRTRLEYTLFDAPAATHLDVEFNHLLRDVTMEKKLSYYSRYFNFTLGQRIKIIGTGNTTFALNAKFYENQDVNQNAIDPGVSVNHFFPINRDFSLGVNLAFDYNRAKASTNDRKNYRILTTFHMPDFLLGFDMSLMLDFLYVDTMEMQSTRGYETTITPGFSAAHNFNSHLNLLLNYMFTKNNSLDVQNYAYSKHLVTLELGYRF